MKVLFLDDELWRFELYKRAFPNHEITWIENPKDFIDKVREEKFDLLSMEHDFYQIPGTMTGMHLVHQLCEDFGASKGAYILLHTWNIIGALHMKDVLTENGCTKVERENFGGEFYFKRVRDYEGLKNKDSFFKRFLRKLF